MPYMPYVTRPCRKWQVQISLSLSKMVLACAVAPSDSEVKWQLNTSISFIFLNEISIFHYIERICMCPRTRISSHYISRSKYVYACRKWYAQRVADVWCAIWIWFYFSHQHSAAQRIHLTNISTCHETRQRKRRRVAASKSSVWECGNEIRCSNTIPNPNILCLYITQVISYMRNKNLSYFPSNILGAHIKYQPEKSICLLHSPFRNWMLCVHALIYTECDGITFIKCVSLHAFCVRVCVAIFVSFSGDDGTVDGVYTVYVLHTLNYVKLRKISKTKISVYSQEIRLLQSAQRKT